MWLIWGGIITDDAKDAMDTSTCRADEFWGQQVAAFIAFSVVCVLHIAAGIHQSKTMAEEGAAGDPKASAAAAAAPKTPCMWAVTLLAFCWNVAYTVYAAILWSSLGDKEKGIIECGDLFDKFDDSKKFLVLWKVTAVLYFINTALIFCLCCMTVCALVGLKTAQSGQT